MTNIFVQKPIALDVGNVICNVRLDRFTSVLGKLLKIHKDEVLRRLNFYQKLRDVGLVTIDYVLEKEFNIKNEALRNKLFKIWDEDILEFNNTVIDKFVEIDKEKPIKIALLSNVCLDHAKVINRFLDTAPLIFKNSIRYYSCDVGSRKPQMLYYQNFLTLYPDFHGCLYLDDLAENLVSSIRFGFKGVQFDIEDDGGSIETINKKLDCIKEFI